jgi:hypothetical protein
MMNCIQMLGSQAYTALSESSTWPSPSVLVLGLCFVARAGKAPIPHKS